MSTNGISKLTRINNKMVKKFIQRKREMMRLITTFRITTNDISNTNALPNFFTHYIYAAGEPFIWLHHSWLSDVVPGFFISSLLKDNHK